MPNNIDFGSSIAIDTETMGLNNKRDRLCLVQISKGDNQVHLVKFDGKNYNAPNLKKLLSDEKILKIFHFARFDVAILYTALNVLTKNVYCTKIASKLARTYTDMHGLKDLCRELLQVQISKQQQSSDWGAEFLTNEQKQYAANDVLYLHKIKDKLDNILKREKRDYLLKDCFSFITTRVLLDIEGWSEIDIFQH